MRLFASEIHLVHALISYTLTREIDQSPSSRCRDSLSDIYIPTIEFHPYKYTYCVLSRTAVNIDEQRMSLNNYENGIDGHGELEPTSWISLRELCRVNMEHFTSRMDSRNLKIREALQAVLDSLDNIRSDYVEISEFAPLFDFDEKTPANGYRSFLILVDRAIIHTGTICKNAFNQKDSYFFRKTHYMKEIEACSQLLSSLEACLKVLIKVHAVRELTEHGDYSLFPAENHSVHELAELMNEAASINQDVFYGRCLGYQYSGSSIKYILKYVAFHLASFSEIFYPDGTLLRRCWKMVQYATNSEAAGHRMAQISQKADVMFLKSCFEMLEIDLVVGITKITLPALGVNEVIIIQPEQMDYTTLHGSRIEIPIPYSHVGKQPIQIRLLSSRRRKGMYNSGNVKGEFAEQSDSLIIHCHGGGFIAQTSHSHECYMRIWAEQLDVPIFSIDYSLAPEAPYPRAIEDILYAYVWALKHASSLLGSTAKNIIFAGDSAGANLIFATLLRCIELNIRRPKGIFMAYVPTELKIVPTPSRLLSLGDAVLPFGIFVRTAKVYVGADTGSKMEAIELDKTNNKSLQDVKEIDTVEQKVTVKRRESLIIILDDDDESIVDSNNDKKSWSIKGVYSRIADFSHWATNQYKRYMTPRSLETNISIDRMDVLEFTMPEDVYLHPYRASDDLLRKLPPVRIVSCTFDPLLDDCIMFAKKLKVLGKPIAMDVLDKLPHGFLNFVIATKEAREGAAICAKRIGELLEG